MNDKELLELAAKAAGIELEWHPYRNGGEPDAFDEWLCEIKGTRCLWNPLTDDGDALRLAVKLHLTIDRSEIEDAAFVYCDWQDANSEALEKHGSDPYAATRRAIVHAAAEIGKIKGDSNGHR